MLEWFIANHATLQLILTPKCLLQIVIFSLILHTTTISFRLFNTLFSLDQALVMLSRRCIPCAQPLWASHVGYQLYSLLPPWHSTMFFTFNHPLLLWCSDTHRSTFDYVVFLNTNLIYWLSTRKNTVIQSNVEVEYQGMENGVAKTRWLRKLHHLHCIVLSSSVTISM